MGAESSITNDALSQRQYWTNRIAVELCRLLRIGRPVRELSEEDEATPQKGNSLDHEHQTKDGPASRQQIESK